jgi:hypothetical protein
MRNETNLLAAGTSLAVKLRKIEGASKKYPTAHLD